MSFQIPTTADIWIRLLILQIMKMTTIQMIINLEEKLKETIEDQIMPRKILREGRMILQMKALALKTTMTTAVKVKGEAKNNS